MPGVKVKNKFSDIAADIQHSLVLTLRQRCDLELLLNGAFFPLTTFLGRKDYESVLSNMRLLSGELWPIPIVLDITEQFAEKLSIGDKISLIDQDGTLYSILTVKECWQPNKKEEAKAIYGTTSSAHPGVDYLFHKTGDTYISGALELVKLPIHFDFQAYRKTPAELKQLFQEKNWNHIVAFQTRNPMHKAHQELTIRACRQHNAKLLIHPSVGMTKPGDIDYYVRVHCYQYMLSNYPNNTAMLSLLPLAMRMAGPREALWHAIIRKNYGCTGFIIGRDHAGPGADKNGVGFYAPYAAQKLVKQYEDELAIKIICFSEMVYVKETKSYMPVNQINPSHTALKISGTEFRRRLRERLEIPEWFSYPEIISELRRLFPPKNEQGFAILFTGFSGAGKSTLANVLRIKLLELYDRPVTLIDGDITRKILSSELGFSHEDREANIKRVGYVASEVVKHKGIVICSLIAPYSNTRKEIRNLISNYGGFIEIYLSTPLEVCEERNPKGIYAKARAGLIKNFTGISDVYDVPENPELDIDTAKVSIDEAIEMIISKLKSLGYLS